MRLMHRAVVTLLAALSGLVLGTATARAEAQPVVTNITPTHVVLGDQPVKLTIYGTGLHDVTNVLFDPPIPSRSFVAFSDTTILVTLPAQIAPGTYAVRVVSPEGGSNPIGSPVLLVDPAPPVATTASSTDAGAPVLPRYSFSPAVASSSSTSTMPGAAPVDRTGSSRQVVVAQEVTRNPFNTPIFDVVFGVFLGGALYILWGKPGRMPVARRRDLLSQAVARPAQRFGVGRICLHCGRLHWVFGTRRDLWRAGQVCSARCFVGAQELEAAVEASESLAPQRMRGVTVYADMEQQLELVLAAEAADAGSAATLFGADDDTQAVNRALHTLANGSSPAASHPLDEPVSA